MAVNRKLSLSRSRDSGAASIAMAWCEGCGATMHGLYQDVQDTETDLPTAEGSLVDGLVLVDCQGRELSSTNRLSKLKRNVISCIRKSVISADDGYVTVAKHTLEVEKADDTALPTGFTCTT